MPWVDDAKKLELEAEMSRGAIERARAKVDRLGARPDPSDPVARGVWRQRQRDADLQSRFLQHGYGRVDTVVDEETSAERDLRWTVVRDYFDPEARIFNLAAPGWRELPGTRVGESFVAAGPGGSAEYELVERCYVVFGPDQVESIRERQAAEHWMPRAPKEGSATFPPPTEDFELTVDFIFRPNEGQRHLFERSDEVKFDEVPAHQARIASDGIFRLVTGVAGSGKTSVALGHLNFLAQELADGAGVTRSSVYQPHLCLGVALTETLLPSLRELARRLDLDRIPLVSYERGIRAVIVSAAYGRVRRHPGPGTGEVAAEELVRRAVLRHARRVVKSLEEKATAPRRAGRGHWSRSFESLRRWLDSPGVTPPLVWSEDCVRRLRDLQEALREAKSRHEKRARDAERSGGELPPEPPSFPTFERPLSSALEEELDAKIGTDPIPQNAVDVLALFAIRYPDLSLAADEAARLERATGRLRGRVAGFVDEVQDFNGVQFLAIASLFQTREGAPPRIMLSGDFEQSVLMDSLTAPASFPVSVDHITHLQTNERQTDVLNSLASDYRRVIQGDDRPAKGSGRVGERPTYWVRPHAESPAFVPSALWDIMSRSGHWTVICPTEGLAETVRNSLAEMADEWGKRVERWRALDAVDNSGQTYDFHVGTVRAFKASRRIESSSWGSTPTSSISAMIGTRCTSR